MITRKLQTQLPPSHLKAPVHAGWIPQRQTFSVQWSPAAGLHGAQLPPSARQHPHEPETHWAPPGHAVQAEPEDPQELGEAVTQDVPEQQPRGHEVGVHWQVPPTHCCPCAQTPPSPQPHTPLAQRLARTVSQGKQLVPEVPQLVTDGVVHWLLLLQHPLGQDAGLQMQPLE